MSSNNFLLILDQGCFEGGLHKGYTCARAKTQIYLHTMSSTSRQEYFPEPVLSSAKSILRKTKLNHTYDNCSNLSHSLIEAMINSWLLSQSSSNVLTFTTEQAAFLHKHKTLTQKLGSLTVSEDWKTREAGQ